MDCFGIECCCKCKKQVKVTVCNCFDEWPEHLIFEKSPVNAKHGTIGYGCTCWLDLENGPIALSRNEHGLCEMFSEKDVVKRNNLSKKIINRIVKNRVKTK